MSPLRSPTHTQGTVTVALWIPQLVRSQAAHALAALFVAAVHGTYSW